MIQSKSKPTPYKAEFTNGNLTTYSDSSVDKGGKRDGFGPHELLEAALANCLNMYIRMYADKNALTLHAVSTTVSLNRSDPDKTCFEYSVDLDGDLTETETKQIMAEIETCPVRKTLSKTITFKAMSRMDK